MDGVAGWQPGMECPCGQLDGPPGGCGVTAFKLGRNGHASKICGSRTDGARQVCAACAGSRATRTGHKKQDKVLLDMAKASGVRMSKAPTNEERARFPWWHLESKSGESMPRSLFGPFMRRAERQADHAAQGVAQGWAVVFTLPDGSRRIWADYETFLRYVGENTGER